MKKYIKLIIPPIHLPNPFSTLIKLTNEAAIPRIALTIDPYMKKSPPYTNVGFGIAWSILKYQYKSQYICR